MPSKTRGQVRYPWAKWFRRRTFTLRKGKDFTCQPHSMAQQIRNAAFRHRVTVSIAIDGNEVDTTITGRE